MIQDHSPCKYQRTDNGYDAQYLPVARSHKPIEPVNNESYIPEPINSETPDKP